jgi:hypothetical protein
MLRVSFADVLDNFHRPSKRLETFAIDDMNLRAAAELTGKFLEGWLKIGLAKENAGQL